MNSKNDSLKLIDIAYLLLLQYCLKTPQRYNVNSLFLCVINIKINIKCLKVKFALITNCTEGEIANRDDSSWYERCCNVSTAGVENVL